MGKELEEAQRKVLEMENVVRTAERNLDVSRLDQTHLSATLAAHVGKLDKLLGHAKSMRQHRADQKLDINAGRRRHQHRVKVWYCCVSSFFFYLIPTFLFVVKALQAEALICKKERQESNRTKRAAQLKAKRLTLKVAKFKDRNTNSRAVETHEECEREEVQRWKWDVRGNQRNKGITMQFEQHVRCALATGATARQIQDMQLLDAAYFLEPAQATAFAATLPHMRWFQAQREGLGLESYLYGFMRIAGASRIIQWGFDETTLDGVSCLNQWAMVEFGLEEAGGGGQTGAGVTIVTLECGGVLPGGTAEEVVEHITKSWERGAAAVEALRAELPMEDRDMLCPLVAGGVNLHKLYGVMHDTCHCANLVATLMMQLQERKKREFLSEEVWELTCPKSRAMFDFLCGNHTRNLPIDRYTPSFLCLSCARVILPSP
jgi:hypothetical protein